MTLKAAPASVAVGYRDSSAQSTVLKPDFDQLMFELERDNASLPFLTSKFSPFEVNDQTYKWANIAPLPFQVAVNLAAGYDAAATSIVIDNASYIPRMAVLRNRRTNELILVLTSTVSTNTLVVTRAWGSTAQPINHNDSLEMIGTAFSEGSNMTDIITTTPTVYTNYTSTQRTPCGMTGHALRAILWTGKNYPQAMREALLRHKALLNAKAIWGRPVAPSTTYDQTGTGYVSGINNDATAAISDCGGLHYWLDTYAPDGNKKNLSAGNTLDENINWWQELFDRGGSSKMIVACDRYHWDMSRAVKDFGQVQLRDDLKKALNLNVTRVEIGGGMSVDFLLDRSLNAAKVGSAADGGWAFAIDWSDKQAAPMMGMRVKTDTRDILIANGGDGEAQELYTEFGFKLRDMTRHGFAWGI